MKYPYEQPVPEAMLVVPEVGMLASGTTELVAPDPGVITYKLALGEVGIEFGTTAKLPAIPPVQYNIYLLDNESHSANVLTVLETEA